MVQKNHISELPLNQVICGENTDTLEAFPGESIDMVFADPPYNLQLRHDLWRPNQTRVSAVEDSWDQFADFDAYDQFTHAWLSACRRVMKRTATLWVIGSYHNIYRVGKILQDLDFWILNEISWVKNNPMPNFRGVRFTNAHETLIWVQKEKGAPYTFNYQAMKTANDGLQMRSDWYLPICTGSERLRLNGEKAHSTQKPEALLYRVIQASTDPGDVILDPFFGTGTTGVVARRLSRHFIGIERDKGYVNLARQRINAETEPGVDKNVFHTPDPRKRRRLPFGLLLEYGLIYPGQELYFTPQRSHVAQVQADGALVCDGQRGSIHQVARHIRQAPCNGWELWYYQDGDSLVSINTLRQQLDELLFNSDKDYY